jgi:hypothetical protein
MQQMQQMHKMRQQAEARIVGLVNLYDQGVLQEDVFLWSFRKFAPVGLALDVILAHPTWTGDKKASMIKMFFDDWRIRRDRVESKRESKKEPNVQVAPVISAAPVVINVAPDAAPAPAPVCEHVSVTVLGEHGSDDHIV